MREKAASGVFRATRLARGAVQKTSLVVGGLIYGLLVFTGVPIALYAFSAGNAFAGSRVLGILGLLLAGTAGLLRLDAVERQSRQDDGVQFDFTGDVPVVSNQFVERVYRHYVLKPRFQNFIIASFAFGAVFLGISFSPFV